MLFARYGRVYVLVSLEVHEAVNSVLPGKCGAPPLAVLPYTARQIVSDTGVKRSGTACQDVNIVLLLQISAPRKAGPSLRSG